MKSIIKKFKKLDKKYKIMFFIIGILFLISIIFMTQSLLLLKNIETLLRILLIPIMAVLYFLGLNYIAAIVFFLAVVTDVLDGNIARKYNLVTDLGKFLDAIADKVLVLAVLTVMLTNPFVFAGVGKLSIGLKFTNVNMEFGQVVCLFSYPYCMYHYYSCARVYGYGL